LNTAFRPSEEARLNLDLPDPIQVVNESASVVRKLLAQQDRQDDSELLTGDEGVPEDTRDDKATLIPIEPESEQSEPVRGQDEGSVSQESLENSAQLVAEDKTHDTTLGSEAPLVPIEPVLEQSEPDSVQDEGPLPIERKDSTAGLIAKDEMYANASDARESSVPVSSDSDRSRPGDTESVEPYIAELLARAEQQIAAKHLVTPAGDAALETYQSILELMPGHSGASQGINRIKDIYLAWARATRQRGLWAKAQSFAERAVTIDPQDTDATQLLDQITAERKLEAEVAALKQLEEEKAKAAAAEEVKALRKP
jgi:tetratricopeptide (TPR) repeat protein